MWAKPRRRSTRFPNVIMHPKLIIGRWRRASPWSGLVRQRRPSPGRGPWTSCFLRGLVLRAPEIAALLMSCSTVIVTVTALLLKRLKLPAQSLPHLNAKPRNRNRFRPSRSATAD